MSATGWGPMDQGYMDGQAWGHRSVTASPSYQPRKNSLVIVTDGSYANGRAGIAYAGDIGSHAEVIPAASSGEAEDAALLLAMHAVYRYGAATENGTIPKADFVTDCDHPLKRRPDEIQRYLASYGQWKVFTVKRHATVRAHKLAVRALRAS